MALKKENTHTHPSTSWEDEDHTRAGSGPFGSPDGRRASYTSSSDHGFDEEVSALQRPARPRRRDLMAGSRPRPIVPKSLSEAYRIAQAVCAAKMAPKGLDTPEACMIAIMHGLEVGLSPLSALQRIAVINGRPTIWGDGALALVKASGLCEAIEEWIEGDDPHTWIAVCNLMRKHDPVPVERRFSTEDAKRARLWGKSGPWSDYPKRMLQMRARAFALRDAFPDVLGGLYLTEEFLAEPEAVSQSPTRLEIETGSEAHMSAQAEVRSETIENAPQGFEPETQFKAALNLGFRQGVSPAASFRPNTDLEPQTAGPAETMDGLSVAHKANPSSVTHTDDGLQTSCVADPIPASESFDHAPPNQASISADGDRKNKDSQRQANAGSVSAPQFPPKLPPLANLRRSRSMPRDVRALRFRNQWSVKQPRGPRKELSQTNAVSSHQGHATSPEGQLRSSPSAGPSPVYAKAPSSPEQASSGDGVASRRTSSLEIQRQSVPEPSLAHQTTTRSPAFIPADDIMAHLDLYDAALCCATDPDTLAEIAEDFTERLSQLPRSSRNDAEQIFEKHQTRIGTAPTHGGRHD